MDFGTEHQRAYRVKRMAQGAAPATINKELQYIRKAFNLAAAAEPPKVMRVPKFEMVTLDNARKVFIPSDVREKLVAAAGRRGLWQRTLLEMAFTYGWRIGELSHLRVRNISLADDLVRLDTSKNDEAREVPLTHLVKALLQALISGRKPNDLVFPLAVYNMRDEWRKICELAGVKHGEKDGYTFHDIRRSSARSKSNSGIPTRTIMQLQGWKSEAMFRRYAIVDQADLRAALDREQVQYSNKTTPASA